MWDYAAMAGASLAGGLTYAVRGRSSSLFGPSVYHGPRDAKAVALTFDDGPTPSTPKLMRILDSHKVRATFFQCGAQVRRHPEIVRELLAAGHEIGNHTDTHPMLAGKPSEMIRHEVRMAQEAIAQVSGKAPKLFRPPYGVRWFGLRDAQKEMELLAVMWTTIGRDWKESAAAVEARILKGAANGAIFCLHDGRELATDPDIGNTLDAVANLVPRLLDWGYRFERVSDLLWPTK